MRDAENIKQLIDLPIAYIGFIFYSKSPRFVHEGIPPIVPNGIEKVGVFVNETFTVIMDKVKSYQLQAVQLHGNEPATLCAALKAEGLAVIKAFGIDETFDWTSLESYLDDVDFFLFDTKSTQHGGTGQSFSWSALAHYPYATPYFLSGGLGLDNIKEALKINDSRLYALDLNSRFEEQPAVKNIHTLTQALSIIQHEQVSGRQ